MSFRFTALAITMFTLLTACGPRDARFNPSHFTATKTQAPPDVVLPHDAAPGARIFGLTLARAGETCCLADRHADLPIEKHTHDSVLVVSVYTPAKAQRLRIVFADGTSRLGKPLGQGFGLERFDVPRALAARHGITRVRIEAQTAPYVLVAAYFDGSRL